MRKLISTALAVIFLLVFASSSWAGEFRDQIRELAETGKLAELANLDSDNHFTEMNEAGRERRAHEITRGQVQGILFDELDVLDLPLYTITWGSPHGDTKDGQQRYIGYTKLDEDFTNPAFPHDAWAGGVLEDREWINEPWWRNELGQQKNKYDGQPKYYDNIASGVQLYYGDVIAGPAARPGFWNNLSNYVHILVPPTTLTWGMGRMWHQDSSGNVWYLSVPLPPDLMTEYLQDADVAVKIEPQERESERPGEELSFTGTVKLEQAPSITYGGITESPRKWYVTAQAFHEVSGQDYPVTLEPLDGAPSFDNAYKVALLLEGVEYKYRITVHSQAVSSKVKLFADPYPGLMAKDIDPNDNSAEALIKVKTVNLKVTDIALSPDPGEPGQLASGVITVKNESEKSFSGVKVIWRVRHSDGSVLDENTIITDLAAGESKQLPFSFTPDIGDTYSVAAMINPDHDNPPNEVNWLSGDWPGDNRMEVSYYVEEPCTDISVTAGINPLSVQPGGTVTVAAFVRRADDGPAGAVPVNVTISSPGGSKTGTLWLDRGGSKSFSAEYSVDGGGDEVTFTVEAWPDGIEDCRPGNNRDSISVFINEPFDFEPVKDGGIRVILIS
ncbi:MAG: hypothetical protein HPY89_00725 [Pelotomaculum sp.]|nr:hypothetical protein [Pelotomaculum sp.]